MWRLNRKFLYWKSIKTKENSYQNYQKEQTAELLQEGWPLSCLLVERWLGRGINLSRISSSESISPLTQFSGLDYIWTRGVFSGCGKNTGCVLGSNIIIPAGSGGFGWQNIAEFLERESLVEIWLIQELRMLHSEISWIEVVLERLQVKNKGKKFISGNSSAGNFAKVCKCKLLTMNMWGRKSVELCRGVKACSWLVSVDLIIHYEDACKTNST